MTSLEKLKAHTTVVADTGDIESIKKYAPQDATTNPSLIYAASKMPQYDYLITDAIEYAKKHAQGKAEQTALALDKVAVNFGSEILKIVPGRVSTEVDARLSFDTEANVSRARRIIGLYQEMGVAKERVLIKIASTWEGIKAAEVLEREGIHCNLTLLFSLVQAQACAEAGVTLISPFAGRITDFFKAKDKVEGYASAVDPGVVSVKRIFNYYKAHGYKTVVMGASFRNAGQVKELAGCDLLTVAPALLAELQASNADVPLVLDRQKPHTDIPKFVPDEKAFRWALNDDEMAEVKTAEGIRKFAQDLVKLEAEVILLRL